jgi:hypothetical protein
VLVRIGLNKLLVLELARCEYILRRENIIALGSSGTGKTHASLLDWPLPERPPGRFHDRSFARPSAHRRAR